MGIYGRPRRFIPNPACAPRIPAPDLMARVFPVQKSGAGSLLLFQHVAGQKTHQPAFEAGQSLGLPDDGLRLLRAP